jgi:hypothetical protein
VTIIASLHYQVVFCCSDLAILLVLSLAPVYIGEAGFNARFVLSARVAWWLETKIFSSPEDKKLTSVDQSVYMGTKKTVRRCEVEMAPGGTFQMYADGMEARVHALKS